MNIYHQYPFNLKCHSMLIFLSTVNINFSAGGFQAKYGDKLSSVLDITYRVPQNYGVTLNASLLGGSLTLEGISPNKKLNTIVGIRYRNNNLFINRYVTFFINFN